LFDDSFSAYAAIVAFGWGDDAGGAPFFHGVVVCLADGFEGLVFLVDLGAEGAVFLEGLFLLFFC